MKNLLFLLLSVNIGGLEGIVLQMCRRLKFKGHTITVVCLDELGAFQDEFRLNSNELLLMKRKTPGVDITLIRRLVSVFKSRKIDAILSHNFTPIFYGSIAARLAGVPLVFSIQHNSRFFSEGKKRIFAFKLLSFLNSKIIAVSQDIYSHCTTSTNIPHRKLQLIYNGVNTEKFLPIEPPESLYNELNILKTNFIVGQVCRLSPEKNLSCLLYAFKEFHKFQNDSKLLLVGEGPDKENLQALTRNMHLEGAVIFTGARKDIVNLLNIMDVFVMTSLTEGVSLTLLEAMACALPVIATRVGGNVEVIEDRISGILIETNNPKVVTEELNKVYHSSSLREELGNSARKRVCTAFDINSMIMKYDSLFTH